MNLLIKLGSLNSEHGSSASRFYWGNQIRNKVLVHHDSDRIRSERKYLYIMIQIGSDQKESNRISWFRSDQIRTKEHHDSDPPKKLLLTNYKCFSSIYFSRNPITTSTNYKWLLETFNKLPKNSSKHEYRLYFKSFIFT